MRQYIFPMVISLLGIASCGSSDFTLQSLPPDFQGEWQGRCVEIPDAGSFIEQWIIKNGVIKNNISIWDQVSCPNNIKAENIKLEATIISTRTKMKNVSTVCKNGKAVITETTLTKILFDNGKSIVKDHKNIRKALLSKKLYDILPEYDLVCIDNFGNLHTGDLNTGNGSTEEKRPKEMNSVIYFIKK